MHVVWQNKWADAASCMTFLYTIARTISCHSDLWGGFLEIFASTEMTLPNTGREDATVLTEILLFLHVSACIRADRQTDR